MNIFQSDFTKYVIFLARFTRWLRTSRLRIFKGKRRNWSESGWRGITYQNKSLSLKVCFETNVRMMRTQMDFIFWKGQKYFFSLALNNDKYLYRNRDAIQCSHEMFYQGGAF